MKYDYDILCIGLGPAGMAVSIMASAMGLRVAAIEAKKIGGECMNVGCIPSKALLRIAAMRHAPATFPSFRLGETAPPPVMDIFAKIASDLDFIRDKKTVKMFEKVKLFLGEGKAAFIDRHTVVVNGRNITARNIFIAAGTSPRILPIPGIEKVRNLLTNENIFSLPEVPASMIVVGGGAIACEMAQAFRRLGTEVTILQRSRHLLSRSDTEAAMVLEESLRGEGVKIITGAAFKSVKQDETGIEVELEGGQTVKAEKLLMAAGRAMNFEDMQLEKAGIVQNEKGIKVNRRLQTTAANIYAVGDCNGIALFSHAAMHQGMIALMNSMMPGIFARKYDNYVVPSTVFTDPQISTVGMSEEQLKQRGTAYETHVARYEDYGAAVAENLPQGFVKVFCSPAGRVYGAVIAGEGSGEMINQWALAIQKKVRMSDIMMLQHSFPTMGFLSKRVAEIWMMNKMQSPKLQRLCRMMFACFSNR